MSVLCVSASLKKLCVKIKVFYDAPQNGPSLYSTRSTQSKRQVPRNKKINKNSEMTGNPNSKDSKN